MKDPSKEAPEASHASARVTSGRARRTLQRTRRQFALGVVSTAGQAAGTTAVGLVVLLVRHFL